MNEDVGHDPEAIRDALIEWQRRITGTVRVAVRAGGPGWRFYGHDRIGTRQVLHAVVAA